MLSRRSFLLGAGAVVAAAPAAVRAFPAVQEELFELVADPYCQHVTWARSLVYNFKTGTFTEVIPDVVERAEARIMHSLESLSATVTDRETFEKISD